MKTTVSDEMVEAGARAICDRYGQEHESSAFYEYRTDVRLALDAAFRLLPQSETAPADGGLRAAVEDLVKGWRADADSDERYFPRAHASEIHEVEASMRLNRMNADVLEQLLAVHPAESVPRPVIDREAVRKVLDKHRVGWSMPGSPAHVDGYRDALVDELAKLARSEAEVGVYYCPTAGGIEQYPSGGFDVCCDAPERHVPVDANFVSRLKAEALREATEYVNCEKDLSFLRERADKLTGMHYPERGKPHPVYECGSGGCDVVRENGETDE